ncbi:MAG: hypothetical protein KDD34_01010 [Bdellovibrionales bacterium]|nr:hypothetical protein [Bdellovibrionales bacterium]
MFFKSKGSSLLLGLLIVAFIPFLIQCAGEDQPYTEPPNLKLGGPEKQQCLSDINKTIDLYIRGELPQKNLEAFWDCLREALITFTDYTKGSSSEVYTAREVRAFLSKFFLGKIIITDPLLNQIMQIKRVFLGGSDVHFSRQEMEKAKSLILELKELTIILNPHVKVFYDGLTGRAKNKQISTDRFEDALVAFHKVAQQLGKLLIIKGEFYRFSDLDILLREIFLLIQPTKSTSPEDWQKYVPLLEKGKQIFIGGTQERIEGNEWERVFNIFSYFTQTLARLQYFILDSRFGDAKNIFHLEKIGQYIEKMISDVLVVHPGNVISFQLINEFIEISDGLFGLPLGLSAQQGKEIVEMLIRKVLTPKDDDRHKNIEGLGFPQLEVLKNEFKYWITSQKYAIRIIEGGGEGVSPILPAEDELYRVAFQAPWPLIIDENGILQMNFKKKTSYDLHSITSLNWQRQLIRILLRSFAADPERRQQLSYLTLEELKEVQVALEPLGVALGIFNPGDEKLAQRIIREASLFMPRSDGKQTITFEEGIEYLVYVLSGLSIEKQIFSELSTSCSISEVDGKKLIEASCFRKESSSQLLRWIHHLPEMAKYFEPDHSKGLWIQFEKYLEITVRKEGYSQLPILRSDIMEMWILLQYIETFFGRFDQSAPMGTINVPDSLQAYEVYAPYLAVLLKGYPISEKVRRAIFTYLMKYGKIHYFDDAIGGSLKFIGWMLSESRWEYEADRLRLVQILASLSSIQNSIWGEKILKISPNSH